MTQVRQRSAGQSSTTHGYTSGGYASPLWLNTIDKFPFSSDTNASDVGDLTTLRYSPSGQSSTVSGYSSGGRNDGGNSSSNVIDKFPFATDTNATDVGDLSSVREATAGQQD